MEENQSRCYALDKINGLKTEENQSRCYALDKINGLKMEENQSRCYSLDKIDGLKMERKSVRLLLPGSNKWVENGKKISQAVTSWIK